MTSPIKKAGIIGLGYVGLPLAAASAASGIETWGFDVSKEKVAAINAGKNYIRDIDDKELAALVSSGALRATNDFSKLAECDVVSICVPTPLAKGKNPDLSYIVNAAQEVKKHLRAGQCIVLESTTYPGTTEEVLQPLLEETGLKAGRDFHLAFSPERVDPGNKKFGIKNTPKVLGGLTPACTERAKAFYGRFIEKIVPVGSPRAAEMVKILENTFRAINIGLANEVAIMCNRLKIDTWDVIDAAATKPFGFMPFYPGPGLGGHCIPIDPHYLVWKLKSLDYKPRFIELADEINSSMPRLVVEKVVDALNDQAKAVKKAKLLVLGVSYKKDIDDYRESPALDVIALLQQKGAEVSYYDPFVPEVRAHGVNLKSQKALEGVGDYDAVLLLTDHSAFDLKSVLKSCRVLVDTRNATRGLDGYGEKIRKL